MRNPSFSHNSGARGLAEARQRAGASAAVAEQLSLHAAATFARVSVDTIKLAVRRRDLRCTWDKQGRQSFCEGEVRAWARERRLILT
jgi:hypothetical protein